MKARRPAGEAQRAGFSPLPGLLSFANAFVVAMLFRNILSFRAQLLWAIAGGVVGVVGMIIRGNRRDQISTAAIVSGSLILATIVVSWIEERFGWVVLIGIVLVFGWLVQRLQERSWKNL